MSVDKKMIYFLVTLIIFLAIILLIKIKITPQYNTKVYAEIYDEFEAVFGKEDTNINVIQNIIDNNDTIEGNNSYTTSNIQQGNVIGKIIIPKIDIRCPIIKETTTEYLKIGPTKYCGPEVNEIRKFSYSRA